MDLLFVKELLRCSTGLEINIIPAEPDELIALLSDAVRVLIDSEETRNLISNLFKQIRPGTVYEINAILGMCYTAFMDHKGNFVLLGPCIEDSFSTKEAQRLLQSGSYAPWVIQAFIEYCRFLPIVSHQKRHQIAQLLAQRLLDSSEHVPFQKLNFNLSQDEKNRLLVVDRYEEISKIRLVEKQHQHLLSLIAAVKQGNLSLAYSFLNVVGDSPEKQDTGEDALRFARNACVVLNARLSRAMEDCGIHPYNLSKIYADIAHQIEKLKSLGELQKFPAEIVRLYCNLSRENRYPNLPPFSKQVVTYIKNHLSDNLSVKNTAAALVMNPDYLSWRFHQETGETFISFVNRERVEQAALLLKNTNMLIKEVASSVGFNNTSYFAKQFAIYTKVSPSVYRNQAKL